MFKFIRQIFVSTMTFFGSLSRINPLECMSMKNQECKVRPELLILTVIILYFILLVLREINVVAMVIILMVQMQEFVFLM